MPASRRRIDADDGADLGGADEGGVCEDEGGGDDGEGNVGDGATGNLSRRVPLKLPCLLILAAGPDAALSGAPFAPCSAWPLLDACLFSS